MLEEQDQSSLKELIPKMGPRLKILHAIEQKYQKPTSEQVDNTRGERAHCVFRGQLKLGLVDGKWNMENWMMWYVVWVKYIKEYDTILTHYRPDSPQP